MRYTVACRCRSIATRLTDTPASERRASLLTRGPASALIAVVVEHAPLDRPQIAIGIGDPVALLPEARIGTRHCVALGHGRISFGAVDRGELARQPRPLGFGGHPARLRMSDDGA